MDAELFAQLHGLNLAAKSPKGISLQKVEDSEFERDLKAYIEQLIVEEKEIFQSEVESFTEHANRIRETVGDALREFHKSYHNGFIAINDALKAQNIEPPKVSDEKLQIFDSPESYRAALQRQGAIYKILGFSLETLHQFYMALNSHFEAGEFSKSRDGFIFLTTIAPQIAMFWLALGISYIKLSDYEKAQECCLHAIELDPSAIDAYLNCVHTYLKTNKQEDAEELCKKGIECAETHKSDPWAIELEKALVDAKTIIKTKGI